jgi:hypothetical protein
MPNPNPKPLALAELQREFVARLRDGGEPPGIEPGGVLDTARAFGVYRRGYYARLTEALGETYAAVWRVLGDADFFESCEAYIGAHPSQTCNLSHYGAEFPEFAARRFPEYPFLSDLARFEWRFLEIFHGPAEPPFDLASALAGSDPETTGLVFAAACSACESEWAIYRIWKLRDDPAPELAISWEGPERLFVYRRAGQIHVREFADEGAFRLLRLLLKGASIASAIQQAEISGAATVRDLFQFIGESGAIVGLRTRFATVCDS